MKLKKIKKAKLIYNPNAGKKRSLFRASSITLEDIKLLLEQYQIPTDFYPTKYPGHATKLAIDAKKEGYNLVIAAGGDGTVAEVANGLVNTNLTLGILPLGSFMNISLMLSIPFEIEKAVSILKIGRTRKIDVGSITKLSGEKIAEPTYFIESAGLGMEAEFQKYFLEFERGSYSAIFKIIKTAYQFFGQSAKVYLDDEKIETFANLVAVSNGPFTGANLHWAPKARLNDHKLTVNIFKMTKWELLKYLLSMKKNGKARWTPKIKTYQAQKVRIITKRERPIHADARIFGTTPVEFKIVPNALSVITGFPKAGDESSLLKRTLLDP